MTLISSQEVVLGKFIHSSNAENSAVGNEFLIVIDFIAGKVPVSDKLLAWLVDIEGLWKLLTSEVHTEGVSAIIWEMNFSDLN